MRDTLPFFDVIVLPTDAGPTDPRIELDGTTNEIRIYTTGGLLYATITPANGFKVEDPANADSFVAINITAGFPALIISSGDAAQNDFFYLFSAIVGAGGTRQLATALQPSNFAAPSIGPSITFFSESQDGTLPGFIQVALGASYVYSMPYGRILHLATSADDALAAGTEEVFDTLNSSAKQLVEDRKYRIEGEATFDAVVTRIILRLRYTEDGTLPNTGSTVLKQMAFYTGGTGTLGGTARIVGHYSPASTLNFRVGLFLQADAATTALGTGNNVGYLDIIDEG